LFAAAPRGTKPLRRPRQRLAEGPEVIQADKRISSRSTFFYKRAFPVIWFGIIALLVAVAALSARNRPSPPIAVYVAPLLLLAIGYFVVRRLVSDLADAVYDEGDALRVRFGNEEERIPLANIINVSYAGLTNPQRITLTLRTPGRFGRQVTFSPPRRLFGGLFTDNPLVNELIERVDAARRR
jgi:hypothetical protein